VALLDEVTKADLRRLETTLSWLQTEAEACRLPPVTPLPLVPGLPAVEPGIDRGTLDRTRHQAPPLPAWLREPETLLPAPPHRGRVLWPRAIKVLMVCAVAAPLSYYFVLATSPLHKRLVEVAAVVSLDDSPVVGTPKQRDRPLMSTAEPAEEVLALPFERNVETAAPPNWARLETPIRPIPQLPEPEAFAIPAPAVPAQATQPEIPQVEVPRVEAPGAETPRGETAKAEIVTGPPATAVAEDDAPSPPVPATRATGSQDVRLLLDQGKQFFDVGDLIAAEYCSCVPPTPAMPPLPWRWARLTIPWSSPTTASAALLPISTRPVGGTNERGKWARPRARAAWRCWRTAEPCRVGRSRWRVGESW
jgi:hypothetical protein